MKRTILTVIAILWALTTGLSASAESKKEMRDARFKENFPYKYEVTLGWGGYPIADDYMWGNGWGCAACASMADIYYMGSLNHMYKTVNGGEYMTGLISGEFNFHYERWLTVSVEAGVNGIWGSRYNKMDGSLVDKMHGAVVVCIPQVQFNWLNRKNVRLYSSAGIGLAVGGYDKEFQIYPAGQLTPFGITVGRKIFIFAEQSIGSAYLGGKFGAGYRF